MDVLVHVLLYAIALVLVVVKVTVIMGVKLVVTQHAMIPAKTHVKDQVQDIKGNYKRIKRSELI